MRPKLLLSLAGLVVLIVGQQLAIPPLAERQVEQRLERDGGEADVSIDAVPAVRLLFGDGGRLEVDGRDLVAEPREQVRVLERLDGFDEVHVRLRSFESGPLEVGSFRLDRQEPGADYGLDLAGATSPRELARFLGSEAGGPVGGILGGLGAGSLPGDGDRPLPVTIRARVQSEDGEPEILDAEATVAEIPAGPLAELALDTVVRLL